MPEAVSRTCMGARYSAHSNGPTGSTQSVGSDPVLPVSERDAASTPLASQSIRQVASSRATDGIPARVCTSAVICRPALTLTGAIWIGSRPSMMRVRVNSTATSEPVLSIIALTIGPWLEQSTVTSSAGSNGVSQSTSSERVAGSKESVSASPTAVTSMK